MNAAILPWHLVSHTAQLFKHSLSSPLCTSKNKKTAVNSSLLVLLCCSLECVKHLLLGIPYLVGNLYLFAGINISVLPNSFSHHPFSYKHHTVKLSYLPAAKVSFSPVNVLPLKCNSLNWKICQFKRMWLEKRELIDLLQEKVSEYIKTDERTRSNKFHRKLIFILWDKFMQILAINTCVTEMKPNMLSLTSLSLYRCACIYIKFTAVAPIKSPCSLPWNSRRCYCICYGHTAPWQRIPFQSSSLSLLAGARECFFIWKYAQILMG